MSTKEKVDRQFNCEKEENFPAQPCLLNAQSEYGNHFRFGEASFQKEASSGHSKQLNEMEAAHYGASKDEEIYQEPFSCNNQSHKGADFENKEKTVYGKPSPFNTRQVKHGLACSKNKDGSVLGETCYSNSQFWKKTEVGHERVSCENKDEPIHEESSLNNSQKVEAQTNYGRASHKDAVDPILDSLSDTYQRDKINPLLCCEDGSSESDVQNDIIGEREKLKKTEEYKQAEEEEWASRRWQLQIQADEAQRLRKRRRAETLRLIDMERRQKQRVEEIRETQKKDEETLNLKECIRVEIRKELDKLEMMYNNMASLLRALGIHVGGGLYPTSREVHAAYKQALLRFHPDRASRYDIRQIVEAEERFKLISRLKDKLLLA